MMKQFTLRKIDATDVLSLQKIGRETFRETFENSNSEEDMKNYLDTSFAQEKLLAELSNPDSEFYFAEENGVVAGYLKINFNDAQTEQQGNEAMELERIYIKSEYQGQGVGQHLYEKALERAKHEKKKYIWLGVWEENPKAIAFYKKNGFYEFNQHIFRLGDDEQTDIMMRLDIR